ncbi:hypothetical protein ACTXT7_001743 [Hymenolepis weldensis]
MFHTIMTIDFLQAANRPAPPKAQTEPSLKVSPDLHDCQCAEPQTCIRFSSKSLSLFISLLSHFPILMKPISDEQSPKE